MLVNELNGVKDSMMDNLDLVLERGQTIDQTSLKSSELVVTSQTYRKNAIRVKNRMLYRRICYAVTGVVVLIILIVACVLIFKD